METAKTNKELKFLSLLNLAINLSLPQQQHYRLTNHRKIPCSKYSGRFITFFEDVFCFSEVPPIDEDVEPP